MSIDLHPRRPARPTVEQVTRRIRTSVVHDVLRIVADPWSPQVLLMVWLGCVRFDVLVDALKISRNTLTQRMALLQDEGCLLRDAADGGHAQYRLTEKGADLVCTVVLNRQWNDRWGSPNRLCPELKLAHACGAPLDARMVCAHCEAEVRARDVKVLETGAGPRGGAMPAMPAYRRARQHGAGKPDASGQPLQGEDLAGDRWTALILAVAFMGLRRNSEIEQAIEIAPNVLAARLALLTDNDILLRVRYQGSPERFEYHLTEKGLDRHAIVLAMMQWGQKWMARTAPAEWNTLHKPCHEWLQPRLVCAACRGDVTSATIHPA